MDFFARRRYGAVLMQRFTFYFAARKDLQRDFQRPRLLYGAVYYDTAMHDNPPVSVAHQAGEATQILFGTDFPFLASKATAAVCARSTCQHR